MATVRINTIDLTYNKSKQSLLGMATSMGIGFPERIEVKSHKTNRVVTFIVDSQKMMDNDCFDGEEKHYIANDFDVAAKYLVLIAQ